MRRRDVIAFIGSAALACPFAAAAQQGDLPVVGVLRVNARDADQFEKPFQRDMRRLGWEEGRNIRFEYRWADGRSEALAALADELVARKVDIIVAFGNVGVTAVQSATTVIPIIGMSDDMVGHGLAASMARPGANMTGVSILGSELDVKRFEMLHEFIPRARRIGILSDQHNTSGGQFLAGIERAARDLGIELFIVDAASQGEVDRALEALKKARVDGVNVLASPVLNAARARIVEELRQARLPAIYEWPETAEEGGLIGYGARITLCYRHVAVLVDKVLRGPKPNDLPIEQPSIFTLAINARTAETLGLSIPPELLLRADEVIE